MQVVSPSSPAPAKCVDGDRFTELFGKLSEDFGVKLKMDDLEEVGERQNLELSQGKSKELVEIDGETDDDGEEEDVDDDAEFSFACVDGDGSPITADEAFQDGQIRPVFPLFDRDLFFGLDSDDYDPTMRQPLRKLYVEDHNGGDEDSAGDSVDSEPLGPYCSWSGRTVADASPDTCRKSNSTGFSKLRRIRELVLRSNSDGKDAFVFMNNNAGGKGQPSASSSAAVTKQSLKKDKKKTELEESTASEKKKTKETATKKEMTSSAHERLYMRNRAMKEEGKHKSYLPYKQVGFFTNVNGLSRNVHPF